MNILLHLPLLALWAELHHTMVTSQSPTNLGQDQALKELQERTLNKILGVCPQPSLLLINQIAAQMDLPPQRIWDFVQKNRRRGERKSAAKRLIL